MSLFDIEIFSIFGIKKNYHIIPYNKDRYRSRRPAAATLPALALVIHSGIKTLMFFAPFAFHLIRVNCSSFLVNESRTTVNMSAIT